MRIQGGRWMVMMVLVAGGCAGGAALTAREPRALGTPVVLLDSGKTETDFRETAKAINGQRSQLANAALDILRRRGFVVQTKDLRDGVIRTAPRVMQLEAGYCVYGSETAEEPDIAGQPEAQRIVLTLRIQDNLVRIRSDLEAGYWRAGRFVPLKRVCLSSGRLEEDVLSEIRREVER